MPLRTLAAALLAASVAPMPCAERTAFDARRLRLEPLARAALLKAMEGARKRLTTPGCAALVDEFLSVDGASLRSKLSAQGVTAADYLGHVVFVDGYGDAPCRNSGVHAFTAPGSRVVRVCGASFRSLAHRDPRRAEAVVIHEMLHTLGLGESPPSPGEITARVLARCGP